MAAVDIFLDTTGKGEGVCDLVNRRVTVQYSLRNGYSKGGPSYGHSGKPIFIYSATLQTVFHVLGSVHRQCTENKMFKGV